MLVPPQPSVPRASKNNKNIFSPKNNQIISPGAAASPAYELAQNRKFKLMNGQNESRNGDEKAAHPTALGGDTGSHASNAGS